MAVQSELGTVGSLWRYPVKSMMGEELNAATFTERWAPLTVRVKLGMRCPPKEPEDCIRALPGLIRNHCGLVDARFRPITDTFRKDLLQMADLTGRHGVVYIPVDVIIDNEVNVFLTTPFVAKALEEGASMVAGGRRPSGLERGFYFEPTVFDDVANESHLARNEVFGPVCAVIGFDDDADAVAMANSSDYGLAGGILSGDRGKAMKMVSQLLYDLPRSEKFKVIFMERNLDEMIASQDKMLERLNRPSAPREQVRQALARQDSVAVRRLAHTFKSVLGNLGARPVAAG